MAPVKSLASLIHPDRVALMRAVRGMLNGKCLMRPAGTAVGATAAILLVRLRGEVVGVIGDTLRRPGLVVGKEAVEATHGSPLAHSSATDASSEMSEDHAGAIASQDSGSEASKAWCMKVYGDHSQSLLKQQSVCDWTDPGLEGLS